MDKWCLAETIDTDATHVLVHYADWTSSVTHTHTHTHIHNQAEIN